VRNGDWDSVRDKQVNGSVRRTDEELGDLESGEGSLDNVRYTVTECGHGVVGVLKLVNLCSAQ
jgi:hypothetical protein